LGPVESGFWRSSFPGAMGLLQRLVGTLQGVDWFPPKAERSADRSLSCGLDATCAVRLRGLRL
jgi:hypothetical protein